MPIWYQLSTAQVFKELKTSKDGLSTKEVKARQAKYGLNELIEFGRVPWYKILFAQFTNIMVLILIIAVVVSALIGEYIDAVAIGVIVILNAVIGFVQEYRAERAIEALKKMAASHAIVIRNKEAIQIDAKELVPGDIIVLEEGMKIPADARLLQEAEISLNEASLTGESTPVEKTIKAMKGKKGIGDRLNLVFMGTTIVHGHGLAVVVDTGMSSEFGKIAHMVQVEKSGPTPLQTKLDHLGKILAIIVVVIAGVLFLSSLLGDRDPIEMFILSISLAVSVIPEGLPAVITLTLAIGVQQMAKKNAIIRKLPAAETLGSTTVICSDKTGTLTQNQMTVRKVFVNEMDIDVTGTGYKPEGDFLYNEKEIDPKKNQPLLRLLEIATLCNNSRLILSKSKWIVTGDPTEGCLLTLSKKAKLTAKYKRLDELVFDSDRKRMSTVNEIAKKRLMLTKGAPDSVLSVSSHILLNGKVQKLTPKIKKHLLKVNDDYANNALRVLGFAYKELRSKGKPEEEKMIFVGMVGMMDPPRPEVAPAIEKCHNAYIDVIMITGDHALTAKAIGKEIGLYKKGDKIITGDELESMTQKELNRVVNNIRIYARVSPHHKVKILKALKKIGHIVAMTGDGVNDAPALKSADIGIAMGITGTDVSKEASEIILTDDNFATIVSSVESGRTIFRNIKKFIRFLLSANFDEVVVIGVVFLMGFPLPFLPLQILWVNLLTDALPAIALGTDPPEPDIMRLKPRDPKASIFKELLKFSIVAGLLAAIVSLVIYFTSINKGSIEHTRTLMFTTIVIFELLLVFSVRFEHRHYFTNFFKNRFLLFAVVSSLALQFLVIYAPFMQVIFKTEALNGNDWLRMLIACVSAIILLEIWKLFHKKPEHV